MNTLIVNTDRKARYEIIIPSVISLIPNRGDLENSDPSSHFSDSSKNVRYSLSQPKRRSDIKTLELHLPNIYDNYKNSSKIHRKQLESPRRSKINSSLDANQDKDNSLQSYFIPRFYFTRKNKFSPKRDIYRINPANQHIKILNSFNNV